MKKHNIMNSIRKIFIIFLISGFALSVFALVLYRFDFEAVFADMTQKNNYELIESSHSGVLNEISVILDNESIKINTHDGEDILIKYYKHNRLSIITDSFEDGKLVFKMASKWSFIQTWRISEYRTVELLLPNSFSGELKLLIYNGFININNLTLSNLAIENYNGTITVDDCTATNLSSISRNGKILISNTTSENIALTCYNGAITVAKCTVTNLNIINYNGINNVELIGSANDYKIELIHGNGASFLNGNIANGTVSWGENGNIYMKVSNGGNYLRFVNS